MADYLALKSGTDRLLLKDGAGKLILAISPVVLEDSFTLGDSITAEKVIDTPGVVDSFSISDEWKTSWAKEAESFGVGDAWGISEVKTPGGVFGESFLLSDGWDAYKGIITAKQILNVLMNKDGSTSMKISRSPLDHIVNKITVNFDRDWGSLGDNPFKKAISSSDATSIARYGEKEKPELFDFSFVRSDAMAGNILNFYLTRLKDRRKRVTLQAFLDRCEVEFADPASIVALGYLICETQKVNFRPGSGINKRLDLIEFEFLEY